MSRIGNRVLTIPENVTVSVLDNVVTVKGPKGELSTKINEGITLKVEGNELTLTRESDAIKKFHGTANSNIENMIIGVTEGYTKKLEIVGVGYRFNAQGSKVTVSAGYSHPVEVQVPAEIRKIRKPEPYKGKGIRYAGEHIRRKEGKKAA